MMWKRLPLSFKFIFTYKVCFVIFILLSCALLGSCNYSHVVSQDRAWNKENGKIKVLTTIAMINDLVARVGADYVDTLPLIRSQLDPHSYELVKGDDEKFARADLIFYNGLGLEHGATLRGNLEGNPKAVALGDWIYQVNPGAIIRVDGQYDPHIWMDVALWKMILTPIIEHLCRLDPSHAEFFRKNGEQLESELSHVDQAIFASLQAIPQEKRYLVTSHDAFRYFVRHYLATPEEVFWFQRCEAPEGLAPDAQLSITDIQVIMEHIEQFRVAVLFPESNVNQDALKKILFAGIERGIAIRICSKSLYSDSMGDEPSYEQMIMHNARVIAEELSR